MKTQPRNEEHMKNPLRGKDGQDYHTLKDLSEANREYARKTLAPKSKPKMELREVPTSGNIYKYRLVFPENLSPLYN